MHLGLSLIWERRGKKPEKGFYGWSDLKYPVSRNLGF
jgi:hypothetical protein